jgi:hypothetical protein
MPRNLELLEESVLSAGIGRVLGNVEQRLANLRSSYGDKRLMEVVSSTMFDGKE